jgi:hypothetical protein
MMNTSERVAKRFVAERVATDYSAKHLDNESAADLIEDVAPKAVMQSGILELLRANKPIPSGMKQKVLHALADAEGRAESGAHGDEKSVHDNTLKPLRVLQNYVKSL